ncbi:MAG: hypothetical protein U9N59_07075 [Campylobacterota bacterium]|nr:hypothetical protein [Campylobacterota bacterium]
MIEKLKPVLIKHLDIFKESKNKDIQRKLNILLSQVKKDFNIIN